MRREEREKEMENKKKKTLTPNFSRKKYFQTFFSIWHITYTACETYSFDKRKNDGGKKTENKKKKMKWSEVKNRIILHFYIINVKLLLLPLLLFLLDFFYSVTAFSIVFIFSASFLKRFLSTIFLPFFFVFNVDNRCFFFVSSHLFT